MRIVTALFFLIFPLISMASETVSKSYQMPIYRDEQQTMYANFGIYIHAEKSGTCVDNVNVYINKIYALETPLARVVAQAEVSDILTDETGVTFKVSTQLSWEYKTALNRQPIATMTSQCQMSCEGELFCQ